jgi:hypothetical protein
MTISKQRLNEIVVEIVESGFGARQNDWASHQDFALEVIRRVEAECAVVGYIDCVGMLWGGVEEVLPSDTKLVSLPLVSEE